MSEDGPVDNIRELLGFAIGQRVVDVLQHDREEWEEDGGCYIEFCFENGARIRFPVEDKPVVVFGDADDDQRVLGS